MNDWLTRLREKLAHPVDGASLAFFRIWFGGCMFVEACRYFDNGWIRRYFVEPVMTFPLPGFEFLPLLPPPAMYALFAVMGVAAVCVMLGLWYRIAIVALFLTHLYVFVIDEANYLNHFYLIALISFLLIWMPADRVWALGSGKPSRKHGEVATVPFWSVSLIRAQLLIVYFYAGIAKLNVDWLHGQPLALWLTGEDHLPVIGPFVTEHWFIIALSYGGLLYDLSVGFLLLFRRTRVLGIIWSFLFHLLNMNLFQIGIFPWLAMGATLIFLDPDWPRRALMAVRAPFVATSTGGRKPARTADPAGSARPLLGVGVTAFLAAWIAVQVLVPLRHWVYPGDVNWTEEGHILSWRMKLRDKDGELRSMIVEDPRSGERIRHDPRDHLTRRQYRKMITRPRMIHVYVQWLAGRLESEWGVRPRIQVDLWSSLNGRRSQPLIDSTADLAAVRMTEGNNAWIVPLSVPLHDRARGSRRDGTVDD